MHNKDNLVQLQSLKCILRKEHLNSDGHHFHQYQLNEQSPVTLIHGTQKDHDI